jgi:uncharacterized protein involved in exopolysaccharide biosynthesis
VAVVREDTVSEDLEDAQRSKRFWLHLVDNFARRWPLYLIPVIVMLLIGGSLAQSTNDVYSSSSTIDASDNPLVGELDVRGEVVAFRQTAADATAEFIGEQLRTDVFARSVADAAGLGDAIDSGIITTDTIRGNISVGPNGDSIIVVRTSWSDPATAQLLGQATIDTYREYVVETVASDSIAAVEFYTDLEAQAREQVAGAQLALENYVADLPPLQDAEQRPIEEELTIQRLNSTLDRAESNVEAATSEIETAKLQVAQSRSEAGQSVRVIDPPGLPLAPEPKLKQIISIIIVFGMLGVLIAGTALVLTTALDRTIRFDLDVIAATGSPVVATVPVVKSLLPEKRRRRRARGAKDADEPPVEVALEPTSDAADDSTDSTDVSGAAVADSGDDGDESDGGTSAGSDGAATTADGDDAAGDGADTADDEARRAATARGGRARGAGVTAATAAEGANR